MNASHSAKLSLLMVALVALACNRGREAGTDAKPVAQASAPAALSSAPAEPGVVLAVDSQTLHMELPQPDIRVEPEAAATAQAVAMPEGLLSVRGEDVLSKIKLLGAKGTLVNVWASWCGACKAEMPMLLELKKRYQSKGIEVLFVSVDLPATADDALRVASERGVPAPAMIAKGSLGYFKLALNPLWKGSLPATFLYDASAKLRYYWGTQVYEPEIVAIVDAFLAGEHIDGVANVDVTSPGH